MSKIAIRNINVVPKLSKIALSESHSENSPYFAGWKAYNQDPYHPFTNPSGVIQMGLAENQVSMDLVEAENLKINKQNYYSDEEDNSSRFRENALFQDYHGLASFRSAMAGFMEEIRGGRAKFEANRIVLTAGATAANELLTFILADPGDALLVPIPYYPGFDRDLRWRTGVKIVPIHCDSSNNFQITPQALEVAYNCAVEMNIKVRGVFITNPSNPLGTTIQRSIIEDILDFVTLKNIHLVSDEIYSGSVFSSTEFTSVAEVLESRSYKNAERVHIVCSLSKDLGLPGFRTGTIYSYNDEVVTTARRMSSFTLISSQTQGFLASMLSNREFTKKYIKMNRDRLKKRYKMIIDGLQTAEIECLKGNAGLFCWMNLKPLLKNKLSIKFEDELELFQRVLKEAKLNISPGSSFHCCEPGWFRICFANLSEQTLQVALQRMYYFVKKIKKEEQNLAASWATTQSNSPTCGPTVWRHVST